jgi:hypothetical protein
MGACRNVVGLAVLVAVTSGCSKGSGTGAVRASRATSSPPLAVSASPTQAVATSVRAAASPSAVAVAKTLATSAKASSAVPSPSPTRAACTSARQKAIPAGRYSGPISADVVLKVHLAGTVAQGGTGNNHMKGTITLVSNGHTVSGTLRVQGGAQVLGASRAQVLLASTISGLTGTISGSAAHPVAQGEMLGMKTPMGTIKEPYEAGLHVTRASCRSVSGDVVALLAEIFKPESAILTPTGKGTWTLPRR